MTTRKAVSGLFTLIVGMQLVLILLTGFGMVVTASDATADEAAFAAEMVTFSDEIQDTQGRLQEIQMRVQEAQQPSNLGETSLD